MGVDTSVLDAQMAAGRYRNDKWERLENGEWVPWPVLTLDGLAAKEMQRSATRQRERAAADERARR